MAITKGRKKATPIARRRKAVRQTPPPGVPAASPQTAEQEAQLAATIAAVEESPNPPPTPAEHMEREIVEITNRHVHAGVHPLDIAKTLAAIQIDLHRVYADNVAQYAEQRAIHMALTKAGKIRRQPSPQNQATKKRKKK